MNTATIAIMCIDGIGPRLYRALVSVFGSAEKVLQQDSASLLRIPGISDAQASAIVSGTYREALDRQLSWAEKHAARILTLDEADYPDILRQIYDPPPVLMVRGTLDAEDNVAFGIVGTRYPDEYGRHMTEHIADGIAAQGVCIVSGMARGIDSIAHAAALKNGTRTIAVTGTSLDRVYPAENRKMYHEIIEKGMVCSEILIGQALLPANFIRRNRIISGLSRGVVVTQAGTRSGALVTALNANEQNRDVFAVPGDCIRGKHTGCHRLIRLGAKITEHPEDVLNEYPFLKERLSGQKDLFAEAAGKTPLAEEEKAVLDCLNKEGVHIDRIFQICPLNRAEIMCALLNLEIKGYVQRRTGDIYRREI